MKQALESGFLGARERKAAAKARKREAKAREKEGRSDRPRVFVLDFKGDMRASAVASLREEGDRGAGVRPARGRGAGAARERRRNGA